MLKFLQPLFPCRATRFQEEIRVDFIVRVWSYIVARRKLFNQKSFSLCTSTRSNRPVLCVLYIKPLLLLVDIQHTQCPCWFSIIMRQGRGSEPTEGVFCRLAKKPLHNGSYERRVPKLKKQNIFYVMYVPGMYVCMCVWLCDSTSWLAT